MKSVRIDIDVLMLAAVCIGMAFALAINIFYHLGMKNGMRIKNEK